MKARGTIGPSVLSHQVRVDLTEARLLGLIERCYDAALDQTEWKSFVGDYAAAIGACAANIHSHDKARGAPHYFYNEQNGTPYFFYSNGISEDYIQLYSSYYYAVDPWFPYALGIPAGTILYNEMLVEPERYLSSEFYNDFQKPRDICHASTISIVNEGGRLIFANAYRSAESDTFGEAERSFAKRLYPHLRRASKISAVLDHAESKYNDLKNGLDTAQQAVFLIDSDSQVFHMNGAASALISEADGLDIQRGRLIATQASSSRALSKLLESAISWFDNPLRSGGGTTLVSRPSGRKSLSLFVTPLGRSSSNWEQQGRTVAAIAGDPCRKLIAVNDHLVSAYGLTRAEARLAEGLVHGSKLTDLAEEFGIASGTARVQLKSVFQKTDTNSQAELVRHILLTHAGLSEAIG